MVEIFSNVRKPKKLRTGFYYAYEYLVDGLRHFIGEDAVWLPEYDQIVEWLNENDGRGLLCLGDYGRGKSVICERIIPQILKSKYGDVCSVISAYDLGRGVEPQWGNGWLVLDDIGVEGETVTYGTHRVLFNELVDNAEKFGKILIITSNLTTDGFLEKYGARTLDRLRKITKVVVFSGDSLRGKKPEGGIPERFRAYGMEFSSREEADAFEKEQDELYKAFMNGEYVYDMYTAEAIHERKPLVLVEGTLKALC